jgi:DNA invertase Pin-like site-specific DNA recombinase/peptidoglycan hydrolase-like protein with peptidoglycan-binding domain
MTTQLVAIGGRTRITSVLAMLVAAAVLLTAAWPASASAATKPSPVLAQGAGMGDKPSAAVRSVQRVLQRRGYDLGAPGVDGRFGPITATAVRRMQADFGLIVDGIVGPKTRKLLRLIEQRPERRAAKRHTTTPKRRQQEPAATTTPPAAQQAPRTTTVLRSEDSDGESAALIAGSAALGALCALLAALALRRTRTSRTPGTPLTPINRELYLEGRSYDQSIGEFRGHALAAAVTGPAGDDPTDERTSYLVDDVRKPAPVWVRGADVRRSASRLEAGQPVIGYVTVSPEAHRTEADRPTRMIEERCQASGWELIEVVTDRETGRSLERPGLAYALQGIAEHKAHGLVVSELRRLSRSIVDLGALLEWFRDAQAALVALDLDMDTSTPSGHDLAATLIALSGWERERISRRTRSGLAEVKASGRSAGRPSVSDRPELVDRINAMRAANMTLQAIADQLNAEGVPTLRGGAMWRPSSVQAALGYRRPGSRSPRDQLPPLEGRKP